MFFTPELLARRDSGFGLLWLAATLGSKSVFKKLPRRSVMTADITQLCDLIAEPVEPLALRLSSNLMYGVVRVYKVKQELFMTDVNSCVISLRKMMQDMHHCGAAEADLLLIQPTARPQTVTIQFDPGTTHTLMFDPLFSGWENDKSDDDITPEDEEEFNPKKGRKTNEKAKSAKESIVEMARRGAHTLNEHHDHLLSTSLDGSFGSGVSAGPARIDLSSSQIDGRFIFEDNFFRMSDGFDLAGDLGDELAKELGWGTNEAPTDKPNNMIDLDAPAADFDVDMNLPNTGLDLGTARPGDENTFLTSTPNRTPSKRNNNQENAQAAPRGDENRAGSIASFSGVFLSQGQMNEEEGRQPLADVTTKNQQAGKPGRKRKRARLLLDARTELTDEELKVARARYLEGQRGLRKEIEQKKLEKGASKLIDDLIWGAPRGIHAEPLVRFWQDNFQVQIQARTNAIDIHHELGSSERRWKGRKERTEKDATEDAPTPPQAQLDLQDFDMDFDMGHDVNMRDFHSFSGGEFEGAQRRSSEEPGQGRRRSRASSVVRGSQFGTALDPTGSASQKSMFPWDNAGASSSADGQMFNDNVDITHVDIRLRSSSFSGKGSPLQRWSRNGSMVAGINGLSPAPVGQGSQVFGEDLTLDDGTGEHVQDSQRTEVALMALEKSSLNFLEYTKMQHQANPNAELRFDTIVPSITSTRHVVSAAFYHCLVLATKNLVSLKQEEAHGPVIISIV